MQLLDRLPQQKQYPTPLNQEVEQQDGFHAQEYEEIKVLINDAQNDESLIDLYESNSDHFFADLIIDKLISAYPESNRSIDFILSSTLDINSCFLLATHLALGSQQLPKLLCLSLVTLIGKYLMTNQVEQECHTAYYDLLWKCSGTLSYPDYYEALYKPLPIHPEVTDSMPAGDVNIFNRLESQFIDFDRIKIELNASNEYSEIRCLVVDICQLEQESEPNVIAKKLTNKIFNSIGRRIPVVQDVSCLERELHNLKFDLGVEKLAIALLGAGDNQAIAQLCHNLAIPSIEFRLFREEQSTDQIVTQIKAWLSEI